MHPRPRTQSPLVVLFLFLSLPLVSAVAEATPDLRADTLIVEPAPRYFADETVITITLQVTNIGTSTAAGRVGLMLTLNNTPVQEFALYDIPPGETRTQVMFSNTLEQSQYHAIGWVDHWDDQAESDEGNNGAFAIFDVLAPDTNPPPPPSLLTPADGTTITDASPSLNWTTVTDPEDNGVEYDVQVADDQVFQSILRSRSDVAGSGWTVSPALPPGAYYWRVRAKDLAGNESAWTAPFQFNLLDNTPPSVDLITPNGGELLFVSHEYEVRWSESGAVTDRAFEISVDGGSTWSGLGLKDVIEGYGLLRAPGEGMISETCLLRITLSGPGGNDVDQSNAEFSIRSPLAFSPPSIALGEIPLGAVVEGHTITVQNVGTQPIQLDYLRYSSESFLVRIGHDRPLLAAGETYALDVTIKGIAAPLGEALYAEYLISLRRGQLTYGVPFISLSASLRSPNLSLIMTGEDFCDPGIVARPERASPNVLAYALLISEESIPLDFGEASVNLRVRVSANNPALTPQVERWINSYENLVLHPYGGLRDPQYHWIEEGFYPLGGITASNVTFDLDSRFTYETSGPPEYFDVSRAEAGILDFAALGSPLGAATYVMGPDLVHVTWQPVDGANGYLIERGDYMGYVPEVGCWLEWTPIAYTSTTSCVDRLPDRAGGDLWEETWYKVKAVGPNDARSLFSEDVYVEMDGYPPPPDAGTTILIHGFKLLGDVFGDFEPLGDYWSEKFLAALLVRFGGGEVAVFNPETCTLDPIDFASFPELDEETLHVPGGHLVVLHDWAGQSWLEHAGEAEAAADALLAALVGSNLVDVESGSAARPIQVIGHSRGVSVASELIQRLGGYGINVAYFSSIDPHDFDEHCVPLDAAFHDPTVQLWSNLAHCDNVWQENETGTLCLEPRCDFVPSGRELWQFGYAYPYQLDGYPHQLDISAYPDGDGPNDTFANNCWGEVVELMPGHGHGRIKNWYEGTIYPRSQPRSADWYLDQEGWDAGFSYWVGQGAWNAEGNVAGLRLATADPRTFAGVAHYDPSDPDDPDEVPFWFFNGDFEQADLNGSYLAGWWGLGGGGGAGLISSERGRSLQLLGSGSTALGPSNRRTHNWLVIPPRATDLLLARKSLRVASPGAASLHIEFADVAGNVVLAESTPIMGVQSHFQELSLPIPEPLRGRAVRLTLALENGSLLDETLLDDIGFRLEGYAAATTSAGQDVDIAFGDSVSVTFAEVTTDGLTQLFVDPLDMSPPGNTALPPDAPRSYLISTTARTTGDLTISLPFDPAWLQSGSEVRMLQETGGQGSGLWTDITTAVDAVLLRVMGATTSTGRITLAEPGPVSLRLESLAVGWEGSDVVLSWRAGGDAGHEWFEVYRESAQDDRSLVSARLTSPSGEFEFRDPSPPEGVLNYWLLETTRDGSSSWYGPFEVNPPAHSGQLALGPPSPNPMFSTTSMTITIPEDADPILDVLDVAGRRIRRFVLPGREGVLDVTWDGRDDVGRNLPQGIYFFRLKAGDSSRVQRVVKLN